MGGKNHQPTNRPITAVSAWLSQRVSKGFIYALEANNCLEDAIILGMEKRHVQDFAASLTGTPSGHLQESISLLQKSLATLDEIKAAYSRISEAAKIEGYIGNPLASRLPSLMLKDKFEGVLVRPSINSDVWRQLEERIKSHNILKTLEWEAEQFEQLRQPTQDLLVVMADCQRVAEAKGGMALVEIIDNNEVPLRQFFAQVFSLWNTLDAMFLYSALMMTELFYRANGYPSLTQFDPGQQGVNTA